MYKVSTKYRWLSLLLILKIIASKLFAIALVWHRPDLLNFSLEITENNNLHDQIFLHIALCELVFTSHYICLK